MPWMPFVLKYWRVGLYGLVALALGLAVWRVVVWHRAYEALPEAQAALAREEACQVPSKCAERVAALTVRQEAITEKVVSDYEAELADLRNRPAGPRRVIRVCPDPAGDVRGAGATSAIDGTGPSTGMVPGAIEFDTGALRDLARDADELSARLRALQQWNEALATPHISPR